MRRVPEVLDCWFESGSMPFAQVHYPFENAEWFEHHYPGDFIVEYIGQTRGWFYTLHVLATALFDRPRSHLRDPRHRARQRRPEDVEEPAQLPRPVRDVRHVRRPTPCGGTCLSLGHPARHRSRRHRAGIRDAVRQVLLPAVERLVLLHALRQRRAATRPGSAPTRPTCSTATCSPSCTTRRRGTAMDAYDLFAAAPRSGRSSTCSRTGTSAAAVTASGPGTHDAFDTLYTALHVLRRVAAPLLPLVTEEMYPGLTGERSVHLTDWPDAAELPGDPDARGRDGPRARRVLGGAVVRKASGPAGPAPTGLGHRGRAGRRPRWRRSATHRRRGQRAGVELTDDVGDGRSSSSRAGGMSGPASVPTPSG